MKKQMTIYFTGCWSKVQSTNLGRILSWFNNNVTSVVIPNLYRTSICDINYRFLPDRQRDKLNWPKDEVVNYLLLLFNWRMHGSVQWKIETCFYHILSAVLRINRGSNAVLFHHAQKHNRFPLRSFVFARVA